MSYDLGTKQLLKYDDAPESSYGEIIAVPDWELVGVVTGGSAQAQTDMRHVYGIGSKSSQAQYPTSVDNSMRANIFAPTADIINLGIPSGGELSSYNFLIGADDEANSHVWRGVGLKVDTMTLEADPDNPLALSMEGIFQALIAQTFDGAHGYAPDTPHIWRFDGLTLTVGEVEDTEKVRLSINVRNNLQRKGMTTVDNGEDDRYRVCQYLREGDLEIEATVGTWDIPGIDLEDETYGCSNALELEAVFVDLCDTSSVVETLTITLGDGNYISHDNPLAPNDYPEYSLSLIHI